MNPSPLEEQQVLLAAGPFRLLLSVCTDHEQSYRMSGSPHQGSTIKFLLAEMHLCKQVLQLFIFAWCCPGSAPIRPRDGYVKLTLGSPGVSPRFASLGGASHDSAPTPTLQEIMLTGQASTLSPGCRSKHATECDIRLGLNAIEVLGHFTVPPTLIRNPSMPCGVGLCF